MQLSTLKRFNSSTGASRYEKKFKTRLSERFKNTAEQSLMEHLLTSIGSAGPDAVALDMPCGIGRFYQVLRRYCPRVLNADYSAPMLRIAAANSGPDAFGQVRLSATGLPFPDACIDLVYSVRLCHHLPTKEERYQYLRELCRISRKWVIVSYLDTYSPHHVYRSALRSLKGKPLKWHISAEEVKEIAAEQGYAVISSTLLSGLFSGQRYDVLVRVSDAHSEEELALIEALKNVPDKVSGLDTGEAAASSAVRPRLADTAMKHILPWHGAIISLMLLATLFLSIGNIEWDSLVLPLGLGIYALGVSLRLWAQSHLNLRLRAGKAFANTGPYRWIRQPLYMGNIGIVIGLTIFSEAIYLAPVVGVIAIALYWLAARAEEQHLEKLCGSSFARFKENVPAWLPSLPFGERTRTNRSSLWLSLRKDRLVLLSVLPFAVMELSYT